MVSLSAPSTASALDFTIRPRINSGVTYYDFELSNPDDASFAGNDILPFIGGGASVIVDRFYIDVYAQAAFSGSADNSFPVEVLGANTTDWDRAEYSLSVGYSVTDSLVVFAGYRRSDTEFDTEFIAVRSGLFTATGLITVDNEQDGPFLGANYGWRIEKGELLDGTLALNLSAAFLDGEISGSVSGPGRTVDLTTVTGDTVGITAGLTWLSKLIEPTGEGLFANGLNYTIGIDGYTYNFEDDTDEGDEFSETVVRGSVGLSIPFDI